jgi:hypothetical protein
MGSIMIRRCSNAGYDKGTATGLMCDFRRHRIRLPAILSPSWLYASIATLGGQAVRRGFIPGITWVAFFFAAKWPPATTPTSHPAQASGKERWEAFMDGV